MFLNIAVVFLGCFSFKIRVGILINADTEPNVGLSKSVRLEKSIKEIKFHEGSLQGIISGNQNPYQVATVSSKYRGALTWGSGAGTMKFIYCRACDEKVGGNVSETP